MRIHYSHKTFLGHFLVALLLTPVLGSEPEPQLRIRAAQVDCDYGLITLHGEFGNPELLRYVLEIPDGPMELTLSGFGKDLSGTDFVDLELPGCDPPGTYRLTVGLDDDGDGSIGPAQDRPPQFYTVLDVTLGAVGRDGLPGPRGERGETGLSGADGADGLACWDLNADRSCDLAEEDKDGDGSCTASDCAGLACWDLDADLACDILAPDDALNEDKNEDGACTALDCTGLQGDQGPAGADGSPGRDGAQGPMGFPGLACWDLNGNLTCEPNEDTDNSGGCDALDCKGPEGPAGTIGALADLEGAECSRDGSPGSLSVAVDPSSGNVILTCKLPEICDDTIDNDGDGSVDCADSECLSSATCAGCVDADSDGFFAFDPAACSGGNDCDDSSGTTFPGAAEVCDGVDNDCDLSTPDGAAQGAGSLCDGSDNDLCQEGILSCIGSSMVCSDTSPDNVEVCDGADNDCNGLADDVPGIGTSCDNGKLGACFSTGTLQCSILVRQLVCNAPIISPESEVCDGIDNDCDGQIDEGLEGRPEVCDGIDNNCNGQVDEGYICPPPDDTFEDNDNQSMASDLGDLIEGSTRWFRNLTMNDDDWYVFDAREGSGLCFPGTSMDFELTVEIFFTREEGDLDLQVIIDGQPFYSQSSTDTELLVVHWSGTCGVNDDKENILVRVTRSGNKFNPDYDLRLSLVEF